MEIQLDSPLNLPEPTPAAQKPYNKLAAMIDHVNFQWALNQVRRRNSNSAIGALMSMAAAMGYKPAIGWRKYYNRYRHRIVEFFCPTKLEVDNACPCCR